MAKGNLALAYQKRGERERAMALYHEIIAREHDAIATANLAMEYYKGGDATQALRYAELSLRGRTNLYQGLFVRAAARGVFGDVSNALQDLEQVLALEPLFAEAQMHLAQFHLRAGDTSSATRVLARYLALEKQDMGRAYQLAGLYEEQRALRDAREWYQYVARHARHHVAWYRCGLLSLKLGEFETARAALERAVQLAPDYAAAWADLAVAHRELGQTARALELSAHAEALAPQSPKVLYDRSCILATSGQTAEALRLLEQAIERAPELRASAKIDPDYAALRHLPAFQQLVTE